MQPFETFRVYFTSTVHKALLMELQNSTYFPGKNDKEVAMRQLKKLRVVFIVWLVCALSFGAWYCFSCWL